MIAQLASRNRWVQAIRDRVYLWRHDGRSFSQHGEDVYLADRVFAGKRDGFYVDIGASHPARISNTFLLYRLGWRGVTVEPIRRLVDLHRSWRPRDTQVHGLVGGMDETATFYRLYPSVLSSTSGERVAALLQSGCRLLAEEKMRMYRLPSLLREFAPAGQAIDFLNLDIEGGELCVLAQAVRELPQPPHCICAEAADQSAARDIIAMTAAAHYELIAELGCNLIFRRCD